MITKIYIDENFAPQLAHGLSVFQSHLNLKEKRQYEVLAIADVFGSGAKDEVWIPIAGKEKAIVITQDLRIQTTRHQRDLYLNYGLGVFFFKPPSKGGFSFWEMALQLTNRWEDIKKLKASTKLPFAFRCASRSKFELLK